MSGIIIGYILAWSALAIVTLGILRVTFKFEWGYTEQILTEHWGYGIFTLWRYKSDIERKIRFEWNYAD